MSMLRFAVRTGLANEAVMPVLRRWVIRGRPMVLMYHELARDEVDVDGWTILRESEFVRQVDYLRRHYRIVSLDELLAGPDAQDTRPVVALTFDDGDAGNFEVLLPLVERLALPVAIFIATGHIEAARPYWFDRVVNALQVRAPLEVDLRTEGLDVYRVSPVRGAANWNEIQRLLSDIKKQPPERSDAIADRVETLAAASRDARCGRIVPLTIEQVKALGRSRHITLGAHSHCHQLLTQIPAEEARESIAGSRARLQQWTGQPVDYFAYPSGDHDDRVVRLIEELGFKAAFTTEERFWERGESPLTIPRMGVGRYDNVQQFKLNLVGGLRALGAALKQGLRPVRT